MKGCGDKNVEPGQRRTPALLLAIAAAFLSVGARQAPAPLTGDEVVARMVAMNRAHNLALQSYTGHRHYRLNYDGVNHEAADADVRLTYTWPSHKSFTVISQSGSAMLFNRVLKPMLKAEIEAAEPDNRERAALDPANYAFALIDVPLAGGQNYYVLSATPLSKNKFLIRGRVYVDPSDFGVVRVEGEPSRNPSWWITQSSFLYSNQKVGEFWLPYNNASTARIRFLGHADLSITYDSYDLTAVDPPDKLLNEFRR